MLVLTSTALAVSSGKLYLGVEDILWRLLCAMVVGMVIGIEREYTHRPAGMRTHILVSLGSCAVMITGQLIYAEYSAYGATPDPARLAAQVIAGVGFLGAGTIMREGANVKGLTTAASLWCVACLGIAAGGGYYLVAVVGMIGILITLTILEFVQNLLLNSRNGSIEYTVDANDAVAAIQTINNLAQSVRCELKNIRAETLSDSTCRITFKADFGRGRVKRRRQEFFKSLATSPAIKVVDVSDESVNVKV